MMETMKCLYAPGAAICPKAVSDDSANRRFVAITEKEKGATVKSHPLNNAFQHGVTAWRLVTRSALSNFVIVR